MTITDALQLTNLLFIPALIYMVKLEHRLTKLEAHIEVLLDRLKPRVP